MTLVSPFIVDSLCHEYGAAQLKGTGHLAGVDSSLGSNGGDSSNEIVLKTFGAKFNHPQAHSLATCLYPAKTMYSSGG